MRISEKFRTGPRRSEDGGGGGHLMPKACIERRKPRGKSMRGVSPLIRGSGGKFLKLDCLFSSYFQVIFINLAG